jgi:hypothetical protein
LAQFTNIFFGGIKMTSFRWNALPSFVVIVVGLAAFISACQSGSTPVGDAAKRIFDRPYFNPPSGPSGGFYGQLCVVKGDAQHTSDFYTDSIMKGRSLSFSSTTDATAIFGNNSTITGATFNGTSFTLNQPSNQGACYNIHNASVDVGGGNNYFTYTISGNTYYDTVACATGNVAITSPSFMDTITKSNGLTVTWSTSGTSGDYVMVSLTGLPSASLGTTSSSGTTHMYKSLADDNGSLTIPSGTLTSFSESYARLTLYRGTYKWVTHNGNDYLILLYTSQEKDIVLN